MTLLAEEVAKKIGVSGPEEKLNLSWINATGKEMSSRRVNLKIQGKGEKKKYHLENVRTVCDLKLPAQTANLKVLKKQWEHLEGFEVSSLVNAVPTILIGADNDHLSVAYEVHECGKNSPILSRTRLGCAVHGPTKQFADRKNADVSFFTWKTEAEDSIHQLVKYHFSTEAFGVQIPGNKVQRFLWRGMDRNKPPDDYELSVLTFGAACSPASALYVKNRNAHEFCDQYPRAEKAIVENHYMDDYLHSATSVEEAAKLIREVAWVHAQGGFEIRGWTSSHPEALAEIPDEMRAAAKNVDLTGSTVERV